MDHHPRSLLVLAYDFDASTLQLHQVLSAWKAETQSPILMPIRARPAVELLKDEGQVLRSDSRSVVNYRDTRFVAGTLNAYPYLCLFRSVAVGIIQDRKEDHRDEVWIDPEMGDVR